MVRTKTHKYSHRVYGSNEDSFEMSLRLNHIHGANIYGDQGAKKSNKIYFELYVNK